MITKRFLSILLCASVYGATYNTVLTKGIPINGFIKSYCITTITPIEENARWSVATNLSNVRLIFNATPLQSDSDASVAVNYYMTFRLCYESEDANHQSITVVDYITVQSNSTDLVKAITNTTTALGETLPLISLNQNVRIMLYDYSTAEKESWPGGYYDGTVTITLEGN